MDERLFRVIVSDSYGDSVGVGSDGWKTKMSVVLTHCVLQK
jgi:hypothetical protein